MSNYWSIREFSKLTGVTVRTLHYYDEQGLLKPHHKNDAGYRFYSNEELTCFKKINILKYMGFNLKQIRDILLNNKLDWFCSLNLQSKVIQEDITKLQHKLMLINHSITFHSTSNTIDWNNMYKIIEFFTDDKGACENDQIMHYQTTSLNISLSPLSQMFLD
jgi:DNA-binding transcriptional MerR regulator